MTTSTKPVVEKLTIQRIEELERYALLCYDHARVLQKEEALVLLEAARRDADVRTLDDWADRGEERYYCQAGGEVQMFEQPDTAPEVFEGATPDEARAKAAAWVRSQK